MYVYVCVYIYIYIYIYYIMFDGIRAVVWENDLKPVSGALAICVNIDHRWDCVNEDLLPVSQWMFFNAFKIIVFLWDTDQK